MARTVVRPGECIAGSEAAPLREERTAYVNERRWMDLSVACISVGRQYLCQRVLGEDRR